MLLIHMFTFMYTLSGQKRALRFLFCFSLPIPLKQSLFLNLGASAFSSASLEARKPGPPVFLLLLPLTWNWLMWDAQLVPQMLSSDPHNWA